MEVAARAPAVIPLRGALWTLGAIVGLFLAWSAYGWHGRNEAAKEVAWKIAMKAKDDSLLSARTEAARTDTLYRQGRTVYLQGRERILHDTLHPPSAEVRACYESADKLISACEIRHRADSLVIAQLGGKVALLENKPNPSARRIQVFGEAQYDVIHMAPVARIGATARLLGPVSLSVAGDLSMPPAGQSRVTARGLVGLRVQF